MLMIMGVAVLMRLFQLGLLVVLVPVLYVSLVPIWWWAFRNFRRLSAVCFATTAALVSGAAWFFRLV